MAGAGMKPSRSSYDAKRRGSFTFGQSLRCALRGIRAASRDRNFRIELAFAAAAVVLGIALGIDGGAWSAVVICIATVLCAEVANTAIETLVDLVSPDYHEMAGLAKDCAAGAVLVASLGAAVVGAVVFLPRIGALLGM